MNVVYTYFEGRSGQEADGDLIRLWITSWQRQGWSPKILTLSSIRRLPAFKRTNPSDYWQLAMQKVGGGFFSKFDVINFALKPTIVLPLDSSSSCLSEDSSVAFIRPGCPLEDTADLYVGFAALLGAPKWQEFPLVRFSRDAIQQFFSRDVPKWQAVSLCGRAF